MTKQKRQVENQTKQGENNNVTIFEELGNFNDRVPRMRTIIEGNNIVMSAMIKKVKIFEIRSVVNTNIDLESIIMQLQRATMDFKINKIQWPTTDELFSMCTIESFKINCLNNLKYLKIALVSLPKIIKNGEEKLNLIKKYHDDPMLGGHCGQKRLYSKLKSMFYWKGMTRDILTFVRNCEKCQMNKPKIRTRESMAITPTPQKPFDCIVIDTIGPFKSQYWTINML